MNSHAINNLILENICVKEENERLKEHITAFLATLFAAGVRFWLLEEIERCAEAYKDNDKADAERHRRALEALHTLDETSAKF